MAASDTMDILNERARFAYNNPNAAVSRSGKGFEIFECAFRFHGIPVFSTQGIGRQVFSDEAGLEKHFRSLILRDILLAQLERLTRKAREVYADERVTVRRTDHGYVINHREPQMPAYVFRSRRYERKIRDLPVARSDTRYLTPAVFSSSDEVGQFLEARSKRQKADMRLATEFQAAKSMAQAAFPGQFADMIPGKRATDTFKYLLVLTHGKSGKAEYGFSSIDELFEFLGRQTLGECA